MNATSPHPQNKRKHPGKRSYSRFGCHTCKIRRLKCDEGRPGCRRCLSTGRLCDGYGVWGGGPASSASMPTTANPLANRTLHDLSTRLRLGPTNSLEHASFDWFMHRATFKLCGVFGSRFWDTLVLQASVTAPAVLHALLALSSAHRAETMRGCPPNYEFIERDERFTLEQYNKAIACLLQPHVTRAGQDGESVRVVLITCVVFVCLELLRGRYLEGQTHLQNGLNLLGQLQARTHTYGIQGALVLGHPQESLSDGYLIEIFHRLYTQSSLFGQVPWPRSDYSPTIVLAPDLQLPPPLFSSMNQARQNLDGLLNEIHKLTTSFPQDGIGGDAPKEFLDRKDLIQTRLRLWLETYQVSRTSLISQLSLRHALSYPVLAVYHTMALVMLAKCRAFPDDAIFDSFEQAFASIVSNCEEILSNAAQFILADKANLYCSERFSFTTDIGLIPPLYYTALSCRVLSIRHRAIHLLETATHREGMWNGAAAAQVAQNMIIAEENIS